MPLPSTPINVSLAGSGQLYPGYIGVLWCLKDYGVRIAEVSTTSGGSIIGAAVLSGYEPDEDLVELAKNTLPLRNSLFDPSWSAIRRFGLLKGDRIEDKFNELLVPKMGDTSLPLYITGANLTQKRKRVFSTLHTPHVSLAKAVRISISLPLVFQPVHFESETYVDGGIALNAPTNVFTNGYPVLGVSFDRSADPLRKFFGYLSAILNTLLDSSSADTANVNNLVIDIGYSGLNYFIGPDDVDRMVERAYLATEKWLLNEEKEGAM